MAKTDLKKELKDLYTAPKDRPKIVTVPLHSYAMVDGKGNPNDSRSYQEAIEALYGVSYTLKFMLKRGPQAFDYVVMPLQGLWWAEDMEAFSMGTKEDWLWTMMILQPDEVTPELFEQAREELRGKKDPAAVDLLRLEGYEEGMAAQVMYIGPYDAEGPTIIALHEFIRESGHALRGKHHEIYMGDPRRTAPERLKTIIRQPIE
jgi:hypothetical protein